MVFGNERRSKLTGKCQRTKTISVISSETASFDITLSKRPFFGIVLNVIVLIAIAKTNSNSFREFHLNSVQSIALKPFT